jgi:lipopolysaccharide export system protein LptA
MTRLDTPLLSTLRIVLRPATIAAVLVGTAAISPALAQSGAGKPLLGDGIASNYKANSGKPIDIEADALEVDDQKKIAVFQGNVSATQGDFNLRAKAIEVRYAPKAKGTATASADGAAGLPGGSNDITQIDAKGKVLITNKNEMTATSEWAMFDVPKQEVTLGGDVVMTQGSNTIKGEKLIVDLKTGVARVDPGSNVAANGEKVRERVRLIFTPKSREKEGEKKN